MVLFSCQRSFLWGMSIFLCSCVDKKKDGFINLTDRPSVDLRRDEMPYLRMGKALGDLSLYAKSSDHAPASCSIGQADQTQKLSLLEKRWKNIVTYVQGKYPIVFLRDYCLRTDWVTFKEIPGVHFQIQVSIKDHHLKVDVGANIQLGSPFLNDEESKHSIWKKVYTEHKKIKDDILSIDAVFCGKRRG